MVLSYLSCERYAHGKRSPTAEAAPESSRCPIRSRAPLAQHHHLKIPMPIMAFEKVQANPTGIQPESNQIQPAIQVNPTKQFDQIQVNPSKSNLIQPNPTIYFFIRADSDPRW